MRNPFLGKTFHSVRQPAIWSVRFEVDTIGVSAQTVAEYLDFLSLVYSCQVKLIRKGNFHVVEYVQIQKLHIHEYGLRVAAWLYGIPYYTERLPALSHMPQLVE